MTWKNDRYKHSIARKGIRTCYKSKGNESIKYKKVNGIWYHKTDKGLAKSIIDEGFKIFHDGNQRFTEGIYFLNHKESNYGNTTIECNITGNFIDMDDGKGYRWVDFKRKYGEYKNYEELTTKIRKEYPNADGISFGSMIVVWKPKIIQECKILE